MIGFPQKTVRSTMLVNIVTSRDALIVQSQSTVSVTIYVDDICVSSSKQCLSHSKEFQSALNGLCATLQGLGLVVTPEKPRLIRFLGKARRIMKVSLREQHSCDTQVNFVISTTRVPTNAIKRPRLPAGEPFLQPSCASRMLLVTAE